VKKGYLLPSACAGIAASVGVGREECNPPATFADAAER
jgi:hypothetical protein